MNVRTYAPWAVAYLVMVLLVVLALIGARRDVMDRFGGPEAQAEWRQWQSAVQQENQEAGVQVRRVPGGSEPPLLVILRDSFPVVLLVTLSISTVLFGFLMLVVRGCLAAAPDGSRRGGGT